MKISAEEVQRRIGRTPSVMDMALINCALVGEPGHWHCGWCEIHNMPRTTCLCVAKKPENTPTKYVQNEEEAPIGSYKSLLQEDLDPTAEYLAYYFIRSSDGNGELVFLILRDAKCVHEAADAFMRQLYGDQWFVVASDSEPPVIFDRGE